MKKFPQHQPLAEMRKLLILRLRGKNMKDMENRSLDSKQSGTIALLPDEERTIENWLLTETSLSRAVLRITALDSEEAVEPTDGT